MTTETHIIFMKHTQSIHNDDMIFKNINFIQKKTYADDPIAVCEPDIPDICLKSSSISNTFANKDFDDLSFNSNSFILLLK